MQLVSDFTVSLDGSVVPILSVPLKAPSMGMYAGDLEKEERMVRVRWTKTLPREEAIWEEACLPIRTLSASSAVASRSNVLRNVSDWIRAEPS